MQEPIRRDQVQDGLFWRIPYMNQMRAPALSAQALAKLQSLVPRIWNFFDTFATEQEHWLPPDNIRVEPGQAIAHRTSPTNIGFLLLAIVAAFDCKLINANDLLLRLERVLTTLERMDRFSGHLFNWYDTLTLEVLDPVYVSSVDSGNLCAALIVVRQACLELAKEDTKHSTQCTFIAQRAHALVCEMDFRFMYNEERELFAIGYDLKSGQRDARHYDLLGSEARLTSYITIALEQVPQQHWFQLGRPFRQVNGAPVLVCWGGSLFEYLMPTLFLPDFPGTLLDETYQRVIECHIRYGSSHGTPWGNGEAGYYAFDQYNNYQYKMFGVPELGLRDAPPELVVASYATFLALPYAPHLARENLQVLEAMGGRNEFGFYESFDFTTSRLEDGQTFAIVKEFMAHHQGICLVALDNYLNDGAIRRRFWSEPSIAATSNLLQERMPAHI